MRHINGNYMPTEEEIKEQRIADHVFQMVCNRIKEIAYTEATKLETIEIIIKRINELQRL